MAVTINKKSVKAKSFEDHLSPVHHVKDAKAYVSQAKSHKGQPVLESNVEEMVSQGMMVSGGMPAQVHFEGSRTINLGNYESVKITVGISVPTALSQVGEAYEWATEWVGERLTKAVEATK